MFGYVRPCSGELKVSEFYFYKSIYCSICKTAGETFGIISRILIGYDAIFIALINISIKSRNVKIEKKGCVFCRFKKCFFCLGFEKEFKFAGGASIILSYFKILDDIKDSNNLFKKIFYFLKLILFKIVYKKATKIYPDLQKQIKNQITKQNKIEENKNSSLDISAEATSNIMSYIISFLSNNKNEKRILKNIGFLIGKWIYIVDAVHDFDKDLKNKNFNPFILKFKKDKAKTKKNAKLILNQILYQIISSYHLLEIKNINRLLENIFVLGFNQVQSQVLSEKFCNDKKIFTYNTKESEKVS